MEGDSSDSGMPVLFWGAGSDRVTEEETDGDFG